MFQVWFTKFSDLHRLKECLLFMKRRTFKRFHHYNQRPRIPTQSCPFWSVFGQAGLTKMSHKSEKQNLILQSLKPCCWKSAEKKNKLSSVVLGDQKIWENISVAVNAVSSQSGNRSTDIKKEWLDIKLDDLKLGLALSFRSMFCNICWNSLYILITKSSALTK